MGLFDDLIPSGGIVPRATTYSPQRGGDQMEGGYEASRPGPDGQAMVRTLEDFRTGASPYVTVAGNPSLYGRQYTMPEVSYQVGGQRYTLKDVPVVVHDTGGAFKTAPEGRFDVPVGRDLGARDTNQGLSGVQFIPRDSAPMAFTGEPARPAGVQAIEGAIRPVPGADPIPPRPQATPKEAPMPATGLFDDLIPAQQPAPDQTLSAAGGAMFDDLIPKPTSTQQEAAPKGGLFNNATAGVNSAIATTLGAPVDAASWLVNKGLSGVEAVTGAELPRVHDPIGGSGSITRAMTAVGVNDPAQVQANTTGEKVARAAGEGAGYMIAPEAMLGALNKAGVVGDTAMRVLGSIFGESKTAANIASNAGVGAAAGAGGYVGGDIATEAGGEKYRPLGELAGNLVGGVAGAGMAAAPRGVQQAVKAADNYALVTPGAQERAAGAQLRERATDPNAAIQAIDNAPRELVPGSQPTTFQLTGDMGLGGLERGVARSNPEAFQQRAAEQNAARLDALGTVQPAGHPEAVSQALRDHLGMIDAESARAIGDATGVAVERTKALGGDMPADAYGAALRGIEAPKVAAAQAEAEGAVKALGGDRMPEAYGADLRQKALGARAVAKERENQLWGAVDPDGSLALPVVGTRSGARDILSSMSKLAQPMAGEEAAIFADAARLPEVIPFKDLTAFRSRVSDAMADERGARGKTVVYGRLTQLRGAIERDIENAVANKAAVEQQAVQAGQMSEADTVAARLAQRADELRVGQAEAGRSDAIGDGAAGAGPQATFSSAAGGASQARGGSGDPAGGPGVQGSSLFPDNLQPNFDAGAAERLKAASAATKERARTFDEGPVGDILRGPAADNFKVADVSVPGRIIRPGVEGFRSVQAFRQAVGNDAAAMLLLRDAAMADLKDNAVKNGVLDPKLYERWRDKNFDALRAFPDFHKSVGTAEKAAKMLADARLIPEGILDGDVGGRIFRSGPGGFESVNKFVGAIGDARAKPLLEDYAVSDLKRAAMRDDGTLDPKKVALWRSRHEDALRALPEVDAKLADPVAASEAVASLAQARKETLDGYQAGVVGRLLNVDNPQDVTRIVGGIFEKQDAVQQMRKLANETAGNKDAREGLRKAIADHIQTKFISNTEAATSEQKLIRSDQFQTFVRKNAEALRAVFKPQEVNLLERMADDLSRANRSIVSVKIPGGSDTAQNLAEMVKQKRSLLSHLLTPQALGGAGALGAMTGFSTGGLSLLGAAGVQALRNAGIVKVDTLIRDAMLNPDLARSLLKPVAERAGPSISLRQALARVAVLSGTDAMSKADATDRSGSR